MSAAERRAVARHFGESLLVIRKRADLSQERTEIGMLERGIRLARIDTLVKLMGALEVSAGELLDGLGWLPSDPRIGSFRIHEGEEAKR